MRRALFLGLATAMISTGAFAQTLEHTKKIDNVACGVSQGLPGFSSPDDQGNWTGIDVDVCRAVAAAIFGDADKVKYRPTSAKERFTALHSGEFDILSRNTTWSLTRDTAQSLDFVTVNYYDGQGFMVRKDLGVTSAKELDGATLCINAGTTTELNAADYFRTNGMTFEAVTFEKSDEVVAAYDAGRCDVWTTDQSGLYANRVKLANPTEHTVLPEVISKEPLGPAVRQGDTQWADIVRWSVFAMVAAEEFGITAANVDQMRDTSKNPEVRRLLGVEGKMGRKLALPDDWAYQIIKQVGNYGESFERNVGKGSPLEISRGLNAQWNKGGLMYAPPVR
ncbi:MAG: amino acid ABC transporter substrate-binding protein [Alphaproteobacteria bacterium]